MKAIATIVLVGLLVACASGPDAATRRDPFPREQASLDETILNISSERLGTSSDDPIWALGLGDDTLIAAIDDRWSDPMSTLLDENTTVVDGGIHEEISAAWLVTGNRDAVTARFVLLDGSSIVRDPIIADVADPPIVFAYATAATNEIVGVELLDADGDLVVALSVDGDA
jgi:hypothetical protein